MSSVLWFAAKAQLQVHANIDSRAGQPGVGQGRAGKAVLYAHKIDRAGHSRAGQQWHSYMSTRTAAGRGQVHSRAGQQRQSCMSIQTAAGQGRAEQGSVVRQR